MPRLRRRPAEPPSDTALGDLLSLVRGLDAKLESISEISHESRAALQGVLAHQLLRERPR